MEFLGAVSHLNSLLFVVVPHSRQYNVLWDAFQIMKVVLMDFDFAVVLDFEATCDEGIKPVPQEVIEFPSVLIDLRTMEIVDEFESFVRPQHHPVLSDFCRTFTSIAQSDVDAAEEFPVVFQRHQAWLDRHGLNERNALFVTCGDWDLKSMMQEQCRAAEMSIRKVPRIYRRWQNIKHAFCQVANQRKAPGMKGMMRALGLKMKGHHHRGIDDCRNIAELYKELVCRGARVEVTKEL